MLKKFLLGAVALGSLGAAALVPTAASASYWGWHGGGHSYHYAPRAYYVAPAATYYRDPCIVRRKVWTHYGWRWQRVNVCY